jgi:tetratricopeptide (TPR) repeat protein
MSKKIYSCFFVAPFGDKTHQLKGGKVGHFELIRASIKEIVESFPNADIKFKRADEISDVGSVEETFIGALLNADVVIADLSATSNANVFYELGIRFALKKKITIPIWQKGTERPADLKGILGIEYEPTNPKANQNDFYQFLTQRLESEVVDSPVYKVLPNIELIDKKDYDEIRLKVEQLEKTLKETLIDQTAKMLWDEAEHLLLKKDQEAALEKFKKAYKRAPQNLELIIRYGQILSKEKHHDEAISLLKSAVELLEISGRPFHIALRELGMAYKRAKKLRTALDYLNMAVEEDPMDSDIHGIIGGVYKQDYKIEKALESYERGFDADPHSTYCLLNIIVLRSIQKTTGDKIRVKQLLKTADELTEQAINKKDASHWDLFDRAHYLLFAGKIDLASKTFDQALEKTLTRGDVESAQKNLNLLAEIEADIEGLDEIIKKFEDYKLTL